MSMKFFGLPDKKVYTKEEQDIVIRQIDGTMRLSGMPLTEEDKEQLRDVLSGRKTQRQAIREIKRKYRRLARAKGWRPR